MRGVFYMDMDKELVKAAGLFLMFNEQLPDSQQIVEIMKLILQSFGNFISFPFV